MIYAEAIQFLYGLQMFGARPGLERTFQLAALVGNPQEQLRFIHVAGTNGKGSTCAMLESIYRAAGLRVGLFTSPHLVSFRERIQVNREFIPANEVARLATEFQALVEKFPSDQHPTMFEVVTVLALRYFAAQKCDLVIWETGLGGRLDATNIVTPLASVITNIGLDHQQWLGNTLPEIAAEKAGIIKPDVPVITAAEQPAVLRVIEHTARQQKSPFKSVPIRTALPITLSLRGAHQHRNAALALAVVEVLQAQVPVTTKSVEAGLGSVHWPGRLQVVNRGQQTILLDGAHNPEGVAVLLASLRTDFSHHKPTLILGILADKDWHSMARQLAAAGNRILTVPVASSRTVAADELAQVCRQALPPATEACSSLADALEKSAAAPFVVITGSLYLVGEALELLRCGPTETLGERALNEWTATKNENDKDRDYR